MSSLIKKPSFTLPITQLVEQNAQSPVADEAKFYNIGIGHVKAEEQATPTSPLVWMSPDLS